MNLLNTLKRFFIYSNPAETETLEIRESSDNIIYDVREITDEKTPDISNDIEVNYHYIRKIYITD